MIAEVMLPAAWPLHKGDGNKANVPRKKVFLVIFHMNAFNLSQYYCIRQEEFLSETQIYLFIHLFCKH